MLLELAKKVNKIDDELTLKAESNGDEITLAINYGAIGELYSITTHDVFEAVNSVLDFLPFLKSPSEFIKFVEKILEEPFTVEVK